MSSVVISGDTSGAITLAAPAVSGTNTATLPAATGTVMVSGNMPAFLVNTNAVQAVTTTTLTKITFQVEQFDTNNNFSSSRFTPTVAGYYQINASLSTNYSTLKRLYLTLYKNGSLYAALSDLDQSAATASSFNTASGSIIVYMNGTTDYLEMYGLLNGTISANNLGFYGDSSGVIYTSMSGSLVRSA
jgi:hypothetical protein